METMQNILTRRSVRKFADKPIDPDKLHTILEAGMSGPCAVNAREWAFIVVTDREKLAQMAEANGRVARMLNQAAAGILVCGDLDRAFPPAPDAAGGVGLVDVLDRCRVLGLCLLAPSGAG